MKKQLELSLSGGVSKEQALELWRGLKTPLPLKPEPIAYKHKGTTIDEDGIRICGSMEFIQAVMSRLTDLLDFESGRTRLGISFSEITCKESGRRMKGRYRCAIQVHQRGEQAAAMNAMFSKIQSRVKAK